MRLRLRWLGYVAGFLVLVLIASAAFVTVTVRKSFPDTEGSAQLEGLGADVTVVRDGYGIPQIYADTPHDLFAAQGYVQAQDRFFEMDFRRHVTAGRLSELFGKNALDTDKVVRTLGWRRVAERELSLLSPETRRNLKAYASGVNAYIDGKSASELSLEYTLLGVTGDDYHLERWTAVDSLAWLKAMAWNLQSNMTDEITRVLSTQKATRSQVSELYPPYPSKLHDPIVTAGTVRDGRFDQHARGRTSAPAAATTPAAAKAMSGLRDVAAAAREIPVLLGTGDGIGSNAWAVSGSRTTTGRPLLANDPHLAPSMPGIWYQMGLHCRTVNRACPYDVSGFTFSGMPGVIIGHNDHVAMGITTMYPDVADLYLEKVSGNTYLYEGKWHRLRERRETFEVAGGKPVTTTVRSTRHGPIISGVLDEAGDVGRQEAHGARPYAVALRWTALTPGRTMDAVFGIDRARDWREFHAAAKHFDVPSQNLVYADTDGHIGYQAPGRIPIRRTGDGRWPVPGWTSAHEWTGYIPYRELPSVLDPESGYVVSSNNQVIGRQYPYLIGTGEAPGYRSQRIVDRIRSDPKLSVRDLQRMQLDTYNTNAEQLLPYLKRIDPGGAYYTDGLDLLRHWNLRQDADSPAAAYFAVFWNNLLADTFHDQLPKDAWPDGGERWFEVVRRLLDDPGNAWWDDVRTKERETRDDILREALRDARDEITRRQSLDPSRWKWGNLHKLRLVNQTLGTSGVGVVERLFNRGPYPVAGSGGLVDATAWDAREGYDVLAVPSMRMVVDLHDFDASRYVQLTGESGHAFNRNYTDQTKLWVRGETLAWPFSQAAVRRERAAVLTLSGTR